MTFLFQPLFWLPEVFPSHIKVILSGRSNHEEIMKEIEKRKYQKLHVKPMEISDRRKMVVVS